MFRKIAILVIGIYLNLTPVGFDVFFEFSQEIYTSRRIRNNSEESAKEALRKFGLSDRYIERILSILKKYFPEDLPIGISDTVGLGENLENLKIEVNKVLEPLIENSAPLSEYRIRDFWANNTAIKYLASAISQDEHRIKSDLEGCLVGLVRNAGELSQNTTTQFRNNLKSIQLLGEVLIKAEVDLDEVLENISTLATILSDKRAEKYRYL